MKNKYQLFLTVPCGILILDKIARGMFCIIKSTYIVSCNGFWMNRQKHGDYLKWTDYAKFQLYSYKSSRISRVVALRLAADGNCLILNPFFFVIKRKNVWWFKNKHLGKIMSREHRHNVCNGALFGLTEILNPMIKLTLV